MTKNEIISELFISKDFNACISKMKPIDLQDDLKAEVALILCEMEEDRIIELHNKGVLKFFTVRIILNQIQSNTSPFYKKFRVNHMDLQAILNLQYNSDNISHHHNTDFYRKYNRYNELSNDVYLECPEYDTRPDYAITEIDNLYWYDREILKLYAKLGTYRAIEDETGIPFESVYKTVQKACKEIRKKVA